MIQVNYVNLANVGRRLRKGATMPGFNVDGKFVSLGTMGMWASGSETFIPAGYRIQDRARMEVWQDPRTIAGCLQMVRKLGHGMDLIRTLKAS